MAKVSRELRRIETLRICRHNYQAISAELHFRRTHGYPYSDHWRPSIREAEHLVGVYLDELWQAQEACNAPDA